MQTKGETTQKSYADIWITTSRQMDRLFITFNKTSTKEVQC